MPMARRCARLSVQAAVAFATVASAQDAASPQTVRLRIADSSGFLFGRSVAVAEALMVPTISVFVGKTGMVRQRGGFVAPFVVLSSHRLGCGRVPSGLPPAVGITKKAAAAMEARLAATKPRPTAEPVEFVPTEPSEFEIVLVGSLRLEREEVDAIEANAHARPETFARLLRPARQSGEMSHWAEFASWKTLSGLVKLEKELRRDEKSTMAILRWREERLQAEIAVETPQISVHGTVTLDLCPPLEHIHVEPKP